MTGTLQRMSSRTRFKPIVSKFDQIAPAGAVEDPVVRVVEAIVLPAALVGVVLIWQPLRAAGGPAPRGGPDAGPGPGGAGGGGRPPGRGGRGGPAAGGGAPQGGPPGGVSATSQGTDLRHFAIAFRDCKSPKFSIESVRLVSEREEKLKDPSGQQWAGLAEIYRATLATKTPEMIRIPLRAL